MPYRRSSQYARFGTAQPLLWVHPTLDALLTDLQVLVYSPDGTLLSTMSASATTVLGAYSTDATWLAPTPGQYRLNWVSVGGSIDESWYLTCSAFPYGDADIDTEQKRIHNFTASGYTAELVLYDQDIAVAQTLDLTEFGASAVYWTPEFLLEDEGQYLFYWRSSEVAPVERDVRILYFGPGRGERNCSFVIADRSDGGIPVALENVEVLISYEDGTPVEQTASDSEGMFTIVLKEAVDYIISLKQDGFIFSVNNFGVSPGDPDVHGVNTFQLFTARFPDGFTAIPLLSITEDLSLMTVDIVDLRGNPLRGVAILLNNTYSVNTATVGSTTYGVMGGDSLVRTNTNGHAEVYLIRGTTVEVTIEGTPVRRRITVPDEDTFNLMTEITGTNDPFTIIQPNIPGAPRSTL